MCLPFATPWLGFKWLHISFKNQECAIHPTMGCCLTARRLKCRHKKCLWAGCPEGSVDTHACHRTRWPELDLRDACSGKRKLAPAGDLWPLPVCCGMHAPTRVHIHRRFVHIFVNALLSHIVKRVSSISFCLSPSDRWSYWTRTGFIIHNPCWTKVLDDLVSRKIEKKWNKLVPKRRKRIGLRSSVRTCLWGSQEDLSSVPKTSVQHPGMMGHVCNPRTGEAERGGLLVLPGQPVWSGYSVRPCLKGGAWCPEDDPRAFLWPSHSCACTHPHTFRHISVQMPIWVFKFLQNLIRMDVFACIYLCIMHVSDAWGGQKRASDSL